MKKSTKFLTNLVVAIMMISVIAIPATAAMTPSSFKDVPSNHWANTYIQYASMNGLVKGHPDGTFHPEDNMTEAECCQVIYNILGNGEVATIGTNQFISWYTDAVAFIERNSQLRISPDRKATRAFLCSLIASFSKKESKKETAEFPDVGDLTASTRMAINYCHEKGIVRGYPDGTFRPFNELTRAEGATVFTKWYQGGKRVVEL